MAPVSRRTQDCLGHRPQGGGDRQRGRGRTTPTSHKDAELLSRAPHLVLDGVRVAAAAVGLADKVVMYVPSRAVPRIKTALSERRSAKVDRHRVTVVAAPDGFVAGEESALAAGVSRVVRLCPAADRTLLDIRGARTPHPCQQRRNAGPHRPDCPVWISLVPVGSWAEGNRARGCRRISLWPHTAPRLRPARRPGPRVTPRVPSSKVPARCHAGCSPNNGASFPTPWTQRRRPTRRFPRSGSGLVPPSLPQLRPRCRLWKRSGLVGAQHAGTQPIEF